MTLNDKANDLAMVHAIYLDDQMSWYHVSRSPGAVAPPRAGNLMARLPGPFAQVYDNLFYNCSSAIMMSGGRGNNITGNIFQHCEVCYKADNRGLTWETSYWSSTGSLYTGLTSVRYKVSGRKQWPGTLRRPTDLPALGVGGWGICLRASPMSSVFAVEHVIPFHHRRVWRSPRAATLPVCVPLLSATCCLTRLELTLTQCVSLCFSVITVLACTRTSLIS